MADPEKPTALHDGQLDGVSGGTVSDGLSHMHGSQERVGHTVFGSEWNDGIAGREGHDVVHGFAGHDVLEGRGGDDTLFGDDDQDRMRGDAGDDSLSGGADRDDLDGGAGDDTLEGGAVSDRIAGNDGDDLIIWRPGDGNDAVYGGDGRDTLHIAIPGYSYDNISLFDDNGNGLHADYEFGLDGSISFGGELSGSVQFTTPAGDTVRLYFDGIERITFGA